MWNTHTDIQQHHTVPASRLRSGLTYSSDVGNGEFPAQKQTPGWNSSSIKSKKKLEAKQINLLDSSPSCLLSSAWQKTWLRMARHAHWFCCLNAQTGSWSVMIHWDVKDCRMGGDPFNVYWHIQPDLPLKLLTKKRLGFSGLFLSLCSLSRCFSSFLSLFFLLVFLLTWWSPQRKRMESSWERSSRMAFKNSYFSLVLLLAPQPMSIYSSVSLHGSSAGTERWPKDGVFP